MEIGGFEKLSYIDYPGELCSVVFINKCNFKCGFCYNPQLVIGTPKLIDKEEILEFLKKRRGKLTGVCITGGEPLITLKKEFLEEIKKLGYKIKLDTNGSFPEKLKELIDKSLIDFVAMDIKGPKEKYEGITNSKIDLKKIEESIKIISKLPNHEFRTTIVESIHKKEDITKMLKWVSKVIEGKIQNFSFQGFQNTGEFIDPSFKKERKTSERYINELKGLAREYCKKVQVK